MDEGENHSFISKEERGIQMPRIIVCPHCKYRFDIAYARMFACSGCPQATMSCNYIKCPKCGKEFPDT